MLALLASSLSNAEHTLLPPTAEEERCPPGCKLESMVQEPVMQDGPFFRMFGHGLNHRTHFWLKEGMRSPLLRWGKNSTLEGRTFASAPAAGLAAQWLDELVLWQGNKAVLEVSMVDGEMHFQFDGQDLTSAHPTDELTSKHAPNGKGLKLKVIEGKQKVKSLDVEAHGLKFSLSAAEAVRFATADQRAKYAHLSIDFKSSFPAMSYGLFAELAGTQHKSPATKAMERAHTPELMSTAPKKHQQQCVCEARTDTKVDEHRALVAGRHADNKKPAHKSALVAERHADNKKPALASPADNKKPALESPADNKKPAHKSPADNKKPALESPADNKKPAHKSPADNKKPVHKSPADNKKPAHKSEK